MRYLACLVSVIVCFAVGATNVNADDAAEIAAIKTAFATLSGAFQRPDPGAIKRGMTADHLSVTPYYGKPKSIAEQVQSLADFRNFKEKPVSKIQVSLVSPDVALITWVADNTGTFKGRPIPRRVFISAIWVKRGGKWLEKFYQATAQKP